MHFLFYFVQHRFIIISTGIFEHYGEIEQFQVVQQNGTPLQIKYIPGRNYYESVLDKIKQEMHEKAGEKFSVKFTLVDKIKPSPSGKPEIVVKVNN